MVEKKLIIKYDNDYDGIEAWLIQKSYNGVIADPYSFNILKREYFNDLQNVITKYLEKGYKIEITTNKNYEN